MLHLDRRSLLLSGAGVATSAALVAFDTAEAVALGGKKAQTKVFKGRFRGSDTPDWKYLPFAVPQGVKRISVEYDYKPTTGGPTTSNVVDIGIFGPAGKGLGNAAGFRGWSGGARRKFWLSASGATAGYLPGPIDPGTWRIALGPYQINATGTPYTVRVTLHFGESGPAFVPTPPPASVPGRGAGWYRGDLHVHTRSSDGSQTQAEVLADAQAAGLDFIGTSEHNTDAAQLTFGRELTGEYADFLVIPGEEVTTRAGHWVAAGLPAGTWIDWRYRPEDDQLQRFTDQVREVGGLSIAAHPYALGTGNGWGYTTTGGADLSAVDAVEVWNAEWSTWSTRNEMALKRWHALLTDGVFKPAVGNSDSHNHTHPVGTPQTVVYAEALSADAVIEAYRHGRSWITGSAAVDLAFTATNGDVTGECGAHVPAAEGQEVAVHLAVTGVPAGATATLLGPGTTVFGTPAVAGDDGVVTLDASVPGGTAFVRAEVRSGATMVALTNPIFLTAG